MPRALPAAISLAMQGKWAEISANLKKMLDSGIFRVWIAPLRASIMGAELRLTVPSAFMADWLERHLLKKIREAAAPVLGIAPDAVEVLLEVAGDAHAAREAAASLSAGDIVAGVLPGLGRRASGASPLRLPLPSSVPPLVDAAQRPLGRWRHSFDDFIIGPSNSMAVAAARDICKKGGQ